MSTKAAALIVAAGSGSRYGGPVAKVFLPVAGTPLVVWSLAAYSAHPEIEAVCLVVAEEYLEAARALCEEASCCPWLVVAGGDRRRDSVRHGLAALKPLAPQLVAIHDGARPLVTQDIISDSLRVCRRCGAAVAAVQCRDTVKQVNAGDEIVTTLDRDGIYLAQTPQTFAYQLICEAHERAAREGWEVTDDGVLLERLGHCVCVSRGHSHNLKLTVPEDLPVISHLLGERFMTTLRVGHGYDLHRLVAGRELFLGGVHIPYERGLLGHSDADAALHAVCDAVLGACALGDIGQHFPDTDPAYANADSRDLTRRVAALVATAGWQVGNVDVTILAQAPKLAPHIEAMRAATAKALGVSVASVSYKATTTEKLGPIGAGEAIAAEAVATVRIAGSQ